MWWPASMGLLFRNSSIDAWWSTLWHSGMSSIPSWLYEICNIWNAWTRLAQGFWSFSFLSQKRTHPGWLWLTMTKPGRDIWRMSGRSICPPCASLWNTVQSARMRKMSIGRLSLCRFAWKIAAVYTAVSCRMTFLFFFIDFSPNQKFPP